MPVANGLAGRRVLGVVLPLLVVGAGLVIPPAPADTDLYWHLSMGRATLATHARAFPDPVGPDPSALYTNPEWVFDTLVYGLQTLGGPILISVLVALLAGISAWLCWRLARAYTGPEAPWTALGITALVVGATNWQFTARPQSLFHVLLPLFLLAAHRAARSGWVAWLGLALVGMVWAQSHSSMVLMPALFLGVALTAWGPGTTGAIPTPGRLAAGSGLCGGLVLLGPFGVGIADQIFDHSGTWATRHIADMHPMPLGAWWPLPGNSVMWLDLLAILAVVGAVRRRRFSVGALALAALGLAATLVAHRFRAAFGILLVPAAALAWRPAPGEPESVGRRALALATVIAVLASLALPERGPPAAVPGEGGARALARLGTTGTLFNTYDAGGYLGWARYGQTRVFIDGRTPTHFKDDQFYAAGQALADPVVFEALHRQAPFAAALVPLGAPLCAALTAAPDWSMVWFDGSDALFVPGAARSTLAPCDLQSQLQRCQASGDPEPFLRDLGAMLALDPADDHAARLGTVIALTCAAPRLDAAARFLDAAERANPDHADLPWLRGLLLTQRAEPEAALAALAETGREPGAGLRLRILRALNRPTDALPLALERVRALDDRAQPEDLRLLAWACSETGDAACATRNALWAALAGDQEAKELLRRADSAGWVLAEQRGLVDAALAGP